MIDQEFLQRLSSRAAALLPAADARRKALEQDMFRLLQSSLGKLNLVTREELTRQLQVLEQANARIAMLEQRVAELEQRAGEARTDE